MGCYICGEPLSSYGFPIINGKEEKVCITCENWKSKYERGKMGTPNDFKVGQKVFVEYCNEWFKGIIYSIEVVKTPKGDMCHYLCYWEHRYCFDDNKDFVEDFSWFENIRPREESAQVIDLNKEYNPITKTYLNKPKELGNLIIKKLPEKILRWISSEKQIMLMQFLR